jgi:Ni/Co efflux regulator RcnB
MLKVRRQEAAQEEFGMKKLIVALVAVAFTLPGFVVAQEKPKEEPKKEEKKKSKKKKKEEKKEEKPPAR